MRNTNWRRGMENLFNTPEYIKSGLVSWFDGINNTGNGHDSTATIWQDLADSSRSIDLNNLFNGSYVEWDDNCLKAIRTKHYPLAKSNTGVLSLEDCGYTLEILHDGTGSVDSSEICGISSELSAEREEAAYIKLFKTSGYTSLRIYGINSQSPGSTRPSVWYAKRNQGINSLTMTVDSDEMGYGALVNFYHNGESVKDFTVDDMYSSLGEQPIRLFNFVSTSQAIAETKIYCIRVYNKVLTASDIVHNYALDKQRFGI